MKHTLALTLTLIILAALFGCTAEPSVDPTEETAPPSAEMSVIETPSDESTLYRTIACEDYPSVACALYGKEPNLEDRLSGRYVIKAEFVGDVGFIGEPRDGSYELEFKVEDTLKGSVDEETIYARLSLDSSDWSDRSDDGDEVESAYRIYNYVEGHRYLLIADRSDSVYYDHPIYHIHNGDFLPLDDDLGTFVWGHDVANDESGFVNREQMGEMSPIEYIEKLCASRPWAADLGTDIEYTKSVDMYEIAKECEFVFAVTPKSVELVSSWRNTATYNCKVEQVIKGYNVKNPVEIGDEIHLPFFIDSVGEGEQYIVMINRVSGADSGSSVFALAAKTAVYDSNEETIAALKEYLAD